MTNLNNDLDSFYYNFIKKELYKTRLYTKKLSYIPKITLLNDPVRETFWLPSYVGAIGETWKMSNLKSKPLNETYAFKKFNFLYLLKIYLNSQLNLDVDSFICSKTFNSQILLLNEAVRKQNIKNLLPPTRNGRFNFWKRSKQSNRYTYISYFFDYSPHRVVSKLRKFNYISINRWAIKNNWLFAYPKMKKVWIKNKWSAPERFRWKYFKFQGMPLSFWVEKQLESDFFTINSFDLTSDTYGSRQFIFDYPPLTSVELQMGFNLPRAGTSNLVIFYWTLKNSTDIKNTPLYNYFSFSYPTHHYTYGAKYLYVKNFYASLSPAYAHAYYNLFLEDNFINVYKKFRWYMFTEGPTYWNLKKYFNKHPHEFWSWELVSFWDEDIYIRFFRFSKLRRRARFKFVSDVDPLGYYNIDYFWFYKTWIHENIFLELISSYYKSYLNFKYLIPDSGYYSNIKTKRKGHFDSKWQDRLNEYTYYWNPDYILPSTRDFYKNYSSVNLTLTRLNSFIALNFSWRFNKDFFFLPRKKKSLLNKNLNSTDNLRDATLSFTPKFYCSLNSNFDFILPLILNNLDLINQISLFYNCLLFLINFLYSKNSRINLNTQNSLFLFSFLSYLSIICINKNLFMQIIDKFSGNTYLDLQLFIVKECGIDILELLNVREIVIEEYQSFNRFYKLMLFKFSK